MPDSACRAADRAPGCGTIPWAGVNEFIKYYPQAEHDPGITGSNATSLQPDRHSDVSPGPRNPAMGSAKWPFLQTYEHRFRDLFSGTATAFVDARWD